MAECDAISPARSSWIRLGRMPLLEQLGEAQHRIRAWNAGAMPVPRRSWHPLCHPAMRQPGAAHDAAIDLLRLISVNGIVEIEREVRDQIEPIPDSIGRDLRQRLESGIGSI